MENNMSEEFMIFDLNQPLEHQPHDGLDEPETPHGRIIERIRQLEAVTSRARQQRQRWRQSHVSPQVMNITTGVVVVADAETQNQGSQIGDDCVALVQTGKTKQVDSTQLIAKALAMDTNAKKADFSSGSFFDCNICLDIATDPILTCCGHLFCWPCFYHLSYADSMAKECFVCKGEVTETSITPIYGHREGNCSRKSKESVLEAPPRPRAARIEGLRQQFVRQGPSSSLIEQRIQQLSNLVGAMGERRRTQDFYGANINSLAERSTLLPTRYRTSQASPTTEASSNQHHDAMQDSRSILQRVASVSSLSSALNTAMDSAERLVEDLEDDRRMRRNHQHYPSIDNGVASSNIAAILQSETQSSDTAAEVHSDVGMSASYLRTDTAVVGVDYHTMNSELNSSLISSSSRRRTHFQRGSGLNYGHSSEPRTRRRFI